MSEKARNTKKWGSRIRRLLLASLLLELSLGLAATVVALVAARLLLPIAVPGVQGLAEFASAAATATFDGLNHGDSQQRLTILAQLKDLLRGYPRSRADVTPKASGKKKCPCRMGTLARPGLKTETRTGKSAHPTSRYDNSCRSPKRNYR